MNENLINLILLLANFATIIFLLISIVSLAKKISETTDTKKLLEELLFATEKLEKALREEFSRQREELNMNFKNFREELNSQFRINSETLVKNFAELASMQKEQFQTFSSELFKNIRMFEEKLSQNINEFTVQQRQKMEDLENRHEKMKSETVNFLEKIRLSNEQAIKALNEENSRKLEEMRKTVDEKLHESLERRLSQSFEQVSERLKQVYEGLGEMKNLATGVGDLKKVLANVKTRGIMGEIQLASILENILSPSQYEKDVCVKPDSKEKVEFAIKLPGKESGEGPVYIAIDSKFPVERYENLIKAYESGIKEKIDEELLNLQKELKRCAKEIRDKYINPPNTTDFAIMFLPFEGLYAEVVKNCPLVDSIQREYHVTIAGPSTLAAFLNCIQMGFRALAIKQRTTEVWNVLAAVKTEFNKFASTLEKAKKKINDAGDEIEELIGKRTRKIQQKLKSVQELPEEKAQELIDSDENDF